jgi:hypothetical protein
VLTFKFNGPFALAACDAPLIFSDAISAESGIYLWTIPYVGGGFIVMYIGETQKSFAERMKEHAIQTLGGNYRISQPNRLREGVDEVLWNGLWRAGTRDQLPAFIERTDLSEPSRQMLRAVRVFVAPFDGDRRLRRRLEAALAQHIWSQPAPASALLPRDIRFLRLAASEAATDVDVATDGHVLGFPARLHA